MSIPYELVRPQAWQKHFGFATGIKDNTKKKQQITDHCLSVYPEANLTGPRGELKDGRSDSILIVRYGWLTQHQAAA